MRLTCPFLACLILAGCGRYADFTLPAPPSSGPAAVSFGWKPDPAPSLSPGGWDSVDVLNPSVLRHHGEYYNLYSGYDGRTWHTGLATAADGVHWRKLGRVLSPRPDTWEGG